MGDSAAPLGRVRRVRPRRRCGSGQLLASRRSRGGGQFAVASRLLERNTVANTDLRQSNRADKLGARQRDHEEGRRVRRKPAGEPAIASHLHQPRVWTGSVAAGDTGAASRALRVHPARAEDYSDERRIQHRDPRRVTFT